MDEGSSLTLNCKDNLAPIVLMIGSQATLTLTLTDRKLHKWHTRSDKATVMDKFGHDIKQTISDTTDITTHMEQNNTQKSPPRIKSKTNLSDSEVTRTWYADRASGG